VRVVPPSSCRFPCAHFLACEHVAFPSSCFFTFYMIYFPMIILLSTSTYCQQNPNTNMWLIPSHLIHLSFLDLLSDHLELFLELCCLCQCLCGLLLDCVHYLDYHFITDKYYTLCLGLFYFCLIFLFLCQYFCYPLLQWLYLSLTLLFLRLRSDEFCLQLLHLLRPFDLF
jgi:hypothetical protein